MNAEDPRLTAFALDALPAAERIQVQRALAENPVLHSELDAIEEFSSRIGRVFQKSYTTSLDESQWAEILSVATPLANPVVLPANQSDWAKSLSPWILPLAATLAAAAIVISTMFYKPGSRQPSEAAMIAKTGQDQAPAISTGLNKAKINPSTAIANSESTAPHQNPPLSATIAEQHSSPGNSTRKVAVPASQSPLDSTPASAGNLFDLAVSEGFTQNPATASETGKALEPELAAMSDENAPLYPQAFGFSSAPIGGGIPAPETAASDSSTPPFVTETPAPKQPVPSLDQKSLFASNQTPKQPLETAAQTSTPKQTPPKSANKTASIPSDAPKLAQHSYQPTETGETQSPPLLASFEGRSFGELPPELVPEDYEILDEHHAIITLADTNTFNAQETGKSSADNGLDTVGVTGIDNTLNSSHTTSALSGATPHINSFSLQSADTLSLKSAADTETPKKINVSVYSEDGVFDNFHPDDLDSLMILSISPPYGRIQSADGN